MLNKFLFEQTKLPLLHKGLDTYALRQKAYKLYFSPDGRFLIPQAKR